MFHRYEALGKMLSKTLKLIKIYVAVAHSGKYVLRYMSVQLLQNWRRFVVRNHFCSTGCELASKPYSCSLSQHSRKCHWSLLAFKKILTFSQKITHISQIAKVFKKKRKEKNNIALTWKSNISSYIFSICAYPCHGGTFFPLFKKICHSYLALLCKYHMRRENMSLKFVQVHMFCLKLWAHHMI